MKRQSGNFIVFEGVGGSGKSTQIEEARKYLESKGVEVLVTREPGGVEASEKIRELIFKLKGEGLANADHQLALFFAARFIWLSTLVRPAVGEGKVVLSDRFDPSTNAYQGWAEGGNTRVIKRFSEIVGDGFKPDAVILIRVFAETAAARKSSNLEGDPFDRESLDYLKKLVEAYDDMARNSWRGYNWHIVDGERGIDEVAGDIRRILDDILNLK